MAMMRTLFVTLLAGPGCLAIAFAAHACSCIYQGPACQAYITGATSGPDGRFELELRQGRVHTFTARAEKSQVRIRSPRLDTGKSAESVIRIIVVEQR